MVVTGLATKTTEDVAGFLFTTHFDEPTRGFREEPDESEEHQEGGNLEADGEPPSEGSEASLVEAASIFDPVGHHHTKDVEREFNGDELST